MRIDRIVLATDFAAASRPLEQAIALAARFRSRLYIFHVVDTNPVEPPDVHERETRSDAFFEQAERRLKEALAASGAPSSAVPIVESVRIGRPSEEVIAFAEEVSADLIVVGTHARTGLRRLLAGSVAESVVRAAPCPVLAVRVPGEGEAEEPLPGPGFERVVAAVDESEPSRAALVFAHDLASAFGGSVTAVHVLDDYVLAQVATVSPADIASLEGSLVDAASQTLRRFIVSTLGEEEAGKVRVIVESGLPAEGIVHVAASERARLICCGTHGRSGLKRALFGSVAERIVRIAPAPVVIVREGKASASAAA